MQTAYAFPVNCVGAWVQRVHNNYTYAAVYNSLYCIFGINLIAGLELYSILFPVKVEYGGYNFQHFMGPNK